MNNESMIYLNNYLEKEFILVDCVKSKTELANCLGTNSKNILSDSEMLKEGDFVLVNNKPNIIYIVKPLDTLESISRKFATTIEEIIKKNNIKTIFIGQQLCI